MAQILTSAAGVVFVLGVAAVTMIGIVTVIRAVRFYWKSKDMIKWIGLGYYQRREYK